MAAKNGIEEKKRPDPDALLKEVQREETKRGRLKIFLGYAPGVGKTYTMLNEARVLKKRGEDVVVGIVETHGRIETEELLKGLEVIPRRRVEYQGMVLGELDVDAILTRRPAVVLVDEDNAVVGLVGRPHRADGNAGRAVALVAKLGHEEALPDLAFRYVQLGREVLEPVASGVG